MNGRGRIGAALRAAALGICLAALLAGCAASCGLVECPADARISDAVRGLIAESPALGTPNEISVQTHRGVVYLRGLVSTPYQIEEAASIAARAPGVTRVENLLSLDNSR